MKGINVDVRRCVGRRVINDEERRRIAERIGCSKGRDDFPEEECRVGREALVAHMNRIEI